MENEKEFENKPITETSMALSKDGRFFIHTTKIVDIKPIKYLQKVMENKE